MKDLFILQEKDEYANYGTIGIGTGYFLNDGTELHVGDIVNVPLKYSGDGSAAVVFENGNFFIMGWYCDSNSVSNFNNFKSERDITLVKSHKDLKVGDKVDDYFYVKKLKFQSIKSKKKLNQDTLSADLVAAIQAVHGDAADVLDILREVTPLYEKLVAAKHQS